MYLSKNSRTKHGRNALVQHGLDLGVEVDDLGVAASETALAHVSLGAGHEGSQFHVGVRLAQFLHHFFERMELAARRVHIVLVHLHTQKS
jgi:hypothetical protein